MRALLSVYDKEGLVELAQGLSDLGWELVASGNTSATLSGAGIAHIEVAEVTGSPEMLGGRVKTLHPKIHGGILADRSKPEHLADLEANGIDAIDLVVCNLYPFSSDPSIELIDIGGPTMVRAAAKNHDHVGIVTSPGDYAAVLEELRASGSLSAATRRRLARAAFAHTAAYDAAIVAWLDAGGPAPVPYLEGATEADAEEAALAAVLPPTLHLTLERTEVLRYGENPHQRGAALPRRRAARAGGTTWSSTAGRRSPTSTSSTATPPGGSSTSWPADAGQAAVAIIKHANPCGAAVAADLVTAYERALECDVQSRLRRGGRHRRRASPPAVADAVAAGPQADVIIAVVLRRPRRSRQLTTRRKATRLLSGPAPEPAVRQLRSLGASVLVQDVDAFVAAAGLARWRRHQAPARPTTSGATSSLAWRVCGRTTSNAIAVVTDGQAVGVGAGQQSRVVAAEIAVQQGRGAGQGRRRGQRRLLPLPRRAARCWPTPASRRWCSRAARCGTTRSSPRPTRRAGHGRRPASGTSGTDGRHPARRRGGGRPDPAPRWPTASPELAPRGHPRRPRDGAGR